MDVLLGGCFLGGHKDHPVFRVSFIEGENDGCLWLCVWDEKNKLRKRERERERERVREREREIYLCIWTEQEYKYVVRHILLVKREWNIFFVKGERKRERGSLCVCMEDIWWTLTTLT